MGIEELKDVYATRCTVCGGLHTPSPRGEGWGEASPPNLAADTGPFDDIIDSLASELYSEQINEDYIHPDIFKKTSDKLFNAVTRGLGAQSFSYDNPNNILKAYLQENIHSFSAAKSITELRHFNSLLLDENGNKRNYVAFRNAVLDSGYLFNDTWLKTEYETVHASAQMADQWSSLSRHNEYLEYSTVGDDRVRPAHAALDGLTLHVSSPVWNRIWPPNDWNCRCTVIPGIRSKASTDAHAGPIGKEAVTNPLFDNNPGKTKTVFKDEHPYFQFAGKTKLFDAEANYGLPSIEKLYANNDFPQRLTLPSESEYRNWWSTQAKETGDDIIIKDKLNNHIVFDSAETTGSKKVNNFFKAHILNNNDNRWKYANNFPEMMTDPDEVWSIRENGKMSNFYLKYFEDSPYVVVVTDKAGTLTAKTMYKISATRAKQLRKGALLYAKK